MRGLSLPRLPALPSAQPARARVSPHAAGRHLRQLAASGNRRAVRRALRNQDETAPYRLVERRLVSRLGALPQRPQLPSAALFGGNASFRSSLLASRALEIARSEEFSAERLRAVTQRGGDLIGNLLQDIARPVNDYLGRIVAAAEKQCFDCPNVPELLAQSARCVTVVAESDRWTLLPPDGFFMLDLRQEGLPESSILLAASVLSLASPADYVTPAAMYQMLDGGFDPFTEVLTDDLDRMLLEYGSPEAFKAALESDFDTIAESTDACGYFSPEALSALVDLRDPRSELAQKVKPLKVPEAPGMDALKRCAASDYTFLGEWAADVIRLVESTREIVNELEYPDWRCGGLEMDGGQFWGACAVGIIPELEYAFVDQWFRDAMECGFMYWLADFRVDMLGRFTADSMITSTCLKMLEEHCGINR